MPSRSMTRSSTFASFGASLASFLLGGVLRLVLVLLVLGFLDQRVLVLRQAVAVPGLLREEHRVGVRLRAAALRHRLQAVAVAEPEHRLAAHDPARAAVVEPALRQVDRRALAVGADQADLARREARAPRSRTGSTCCPGSTGSTARLRRAPCWSAARGSAWSRGCRPSASSGPRRTPSPCRRASRRAWRYLVGRTMSGVSFSTVDA